MAEKSYIDRYQRAELLKETILGFTPPYDPGAPTPTEQDLRIPAFVAKLASVNAANIAVDNLAAAYGLTASERVAHLSLVLEAATTVLAYLRTKKSTLGPLLTSADTIVKRMRGSKAKAKAPEPTPPEPTPPPKTRNRGNQSYMEQEGHLRTLINLVTGKPGYNPLPAGTHHASVGYLNGLLSTFRAINTQICAHDADLVHAEDLRADAYENKVTGLHPLFLAVKSSVQSQYGAASPQFASVDGIVW